MTVTITIIITFVTTTVTITGSLGLGGDLGNMWREVEEGKRVVHQRSAQLRARGEIERW